MNGNLLSLAVDVPGNCKAEDEEAAVAGNEGADDAAADASTETAKALTDDSDLAANNMEVSEDSSAIDKELQKTEKIEETQDQVESNKIDMDLDDLAADAAADTEDKEQTSAIGKKKGTRKKRSTNWEEAERILLLEVIKPKVDFVENRSVDAKSIKAKHLAWVHITKQFNGLNFRHRSLEQIKVQWRSMKNVAKREFQQKHPKDNYVEGSGLVEFMEELQKDTNVLRAQARTAAVVKKENPELDDEDTPLAALPTTTNSSDDNLTQTSNNVALPSPPLSAAESQPDMPKDAAAATRKRKKPGPQPGFKQKLQQAQSQQQLAADANNSPKAKRQRTQSVKKEPLETTSNTSCNTLANDSIATSLEQSPLAMALSAGTENPVSPTIASNHSIHSNLNCSLDVAKLSFSHTNNTNNNNVSSNNNIANNISSGNTNNNNNNSSTVGASNHIASMGVDEKYKKQMFDLLKRARLAEMDYVRREHEQKLRFAQMEQELKLNYSRQTEDLKLRLMREEHEVRMRQCQIEHEARMRIYAGNATLKRINAKASPLDVNVSSEANNFN